MTALDRAPGVQLLRPVGRLLAGMPADRRGIEQHARALQGGEPCSLRVPLVPADQGPDLADLGVEGLESEVTGREVELLVVRRVVGDVHLAIEPGYRAIAVNDDRTVVIQPGSPLLEYGNYHGGLGLTSDFGHGFRAWTGDRLRQVEQARVLALGEVERAKQLGQADDPRAFARGFANP